MVMLEACDVPVVSTCFLAAFPSSLTYPVIRSEAAKSYFGLGNHTHLGGTGRAFHADEKP
jgi:hypothetical protein